MESGDERHEVYEFGWWPEIAGAIAVAVLVSCLLAFARGSL